METKYETIGVDTPEDLQKLKEYLEKEKYDDANKGK
jgi:CMP-2-keto-3-deoxyoctulosonic acid synthetase